jgi:sugar phosphate isomerase/epimerase
MQLVLFDTPEISNIPSPKEAAELASAARDNGMAFTVHLPSNIEPGSPDLRRREASSELFRRVVGVTSQLEPICWTLHIPLPEDESMDGYLDRAKETLAPLMREFRTPRDLAIENIYPVFEVEPPIIEEFGASVCIDVGHLVYFGLDVWSFLDRWLMKCRNMHLHGCLDVKDHESLAHLPDGFLCDLFARVSREPDLRTVTMEIFGEKDFESSIDALKIALPGFPPPRFATQCFPED